MTKKHKAVEKQRAVDALREIVKPGDKLYTTVTHVARSGAYRHIKVMKHTPDYITDISGLVADALGARYFNDGVGISGGGMDMTFYIIYELSRVLFPTGFECIGFDDEYSKRCPSNDHMNGDKNYAPHHHKSGGYALRREHL